MHLLTSLLIGSITAADHHKFLPAQFPGSAQIANLSSTSQFLPNDFMWGYASASFQVEGAVSEDGKTASIWDTFASVQGKIKNGDSPKIANDEYHRFAETVRLLKESGAKSYRMSISWPRLVPGGVRGSKVNQLAVQHYNHAFDLLLQNGIEPFVTLYHWDLPQVLQDNYNGLTDYHEFPQDFLYYSEQAFKAFGAKVKYWLTFNEPISYCLLGYQTGLHAPGHCSDRKKCKKGNGITDALKCGHSTILAHAFAVDLYRKQYQQDQGGRISIAPNAEWAEPLTDSWIDHTFAQLKMDFSFGWFADPIFLTGHYPWQMRTVFFFQLPWFSWAESDLIKGSADFVSVNHYTSTYVTYPLYKTKSIKQEGSIGWTAIYASKNGTAIGNRAESDWLYNVPWGFTKLLKYIKERYNNPEIYITENGFSVPNEQRENLVGALSDPERVDYFNGYLLAMKKAIVESNVRVKGYFAWTLVDNFEWAVGYQERFGVTHVDFKTQKRTMKASAYFLKYFFSHAIMN